MRGVYIDTKFSWDIFQNFARKQATSASLPAVVLQRINEPALEGLNTTLIDASAPYARPRSLNEAEVDHLMPGIGAGAFWGRSGNRYRYMNSHRFLTELTIELEHQKGRFSDLGLEEFWLPCLAHGFDHYMVCLGAHLSGTRYLNLAPTLFPWAVSIIEGFDYQNRVVDVSFGPTTDIGLMTGFIERGWDFNDENQIGLLGESLLKNDLLSFNPMEKIRTSVSKHRRAGYERKSVSAPTPGSVVIYLHYQPELTTIPAAGITAAQNVLIRRLKSEYSDVFLKEHPTQFLLSHTLIGGGRWSSYYTDFHQEYGVDFLSMDCTLERLLEAKCVLCAANGTAVLEYLRMGGIVVLPKETCLLSRESIKALSISNGMVRITPDQLPDLISTEAKYVYDVEDKAIMNRPETRIQFMFKMAAR